MHYSDSESKLSLNQEDSIMNTNDTKDSLIRPIDPIDDYLECVTFCSVSNRAEENDCQTICMERHLKKTYF